MRSVSDERQLICYPPERFVQLIIGMSHDTGDSKSKILEHAVRHFFNSITPSDIERYNRIYHSLTPEQKKKPKKNGKRIS